MQSGIFLLANQLAGPAQMGRMMHGGGGPGFFLGGLVHIVWTALIVLAVLWIVRNWARITGYVRNSASAIQMGSPAASVTQTPLEIVQTRYARGEITREEYEAIRRDLTGEAPAAAPAAQA